MFQTSSRPVIRDMSKSLVSLPKNLHTSIRPMAEHTSICALNDELHRAVYRLGSTRKRTHAFRRLPMAGSPRFAHANRKALIYSE